MGGSNSIPSSLIHDNLNRYNSAPRNNKVQPPSSVWGPSPATAAAPEDVILKTPEEIEKEKEEKEKERQEYYKKNALAISVHKEMCLQRTLNKNYKVKIPIDTIHKFPVDVFFVFTWLAQLSVNSEEYYVEFHIYEKGNLQKLLYMERLTLPPRHSSIPCVMKDYDYFIKRCSALDYIFELNYYFKLMNDAILNLKKDTYAECFTIHEINVTCEDFSLDQKVPNEHVEFSQMYTCEKCGGRTKNKSCICYFCGGAAAPHVAEPAQNTAAVPAQNTSAVPAQNTADRSSP